MNLGLDAYTRNARLKPALVAALPAAWTVYPRPHAAERSLLVSARKANARPGEDRAFFSPLSEPRGGGGDRFLGKPQPLRPRLSALLFYVAMLSKVSTPHFKIPLTKSRCLEIAA